MKKLMIGLVSLMLSCPIFADEGMWILSLIKQQKFPEMQALGLKLQDYDIYNPDSSSIKDAVVIFGGGCTGEVISGEGLILTNHHCGYGMIQQHSSLEHDYLTDGFWANTRDKELPNKGLKVTFIDKIEDVTDYVKEALSKETDPNSMSYLSPRYLNALAKEKVGEKFLQDNPGTEMEIKAFYGGNQYFMFTKKIYTDVRLVGAPPSSIGKFGADTDNWMWPRHSGDFALFRVYADANGNPADYAENNVPLRSKRWLKISTKGVQENDFAMMIGFPGTTNKYYTSWEVAERRDIDNRVRIDMRELRQGVMLQAMLADPAIRIQYSSKYASSTNAYKNAIGTNWAIDKQNFEQVKKNEQDKLIAWSKQNNKPEYTEAIQQIEQIVSERADLRFRSWMVDEALLRAIEFTSIPTKHEALIEALQKKDKTAIDREIETFKASFEAFADKNYSRELDQSISKVMLKAYTEKVPADKAPRAMVALYQKFKGNVDAYVNWLFDNSIFGNTKLYDSFLKKPSAAKLTNDPLLQLVTSIREEKSNLTKQLAGYTGGYAKAHQTYIKGLLEMYGDDISFPDANFTMRLTYGQMKGYKPSDAVYYMPQTTLEGVMEKEDPNNWEFVVAPKLKELYQRKDYGPYAMANGQMPVCFAATTHSTGGNSGSPVLDANGALIGLNFDRNWEGVGGDIQYLPDYQRSIIVDIRYVLFIIDKFAGAQHLIDEMDFIE